MNARHWLRLFAGELIGTYIMVFFGVGAAATATLLGTMTGNYQVGMVWGITIAIAIYVCRHLSGAHFNPAVSLAMVVGKRMPARELIPYLAGQFVGAFAAGMSLVAIFDDTVRNWLPQHGFAWDEISPASTVWFDTYPNNAAATLNMWEAAFAEAFCVMLLIIVIFSLTSTDNTGRPNTHLAPLFIGLTVTIIIGVLGPLTNAGLNPARDLGPRLAGLIMGWDASLAFYPGVAVVYWIAPLVGAVVGALAYNCLIGPLHKKCINDSSIPCEPRSALCGDPECDRAARANFSDDF